MSHPTIDGGAKQRIAQPGAVPEAISAPGASPAPATPSPSPALAAALEVVRQHAADGEFAPPVDGDRTILLTLKALRDDVDALWAAACESDIPDDVLLAVEGSLERADDLLTATGMLAVRADGPVAVEGGEPSNSGGFVPPAGAASWAGETLREAARRLLPVPEGGVSVVGLAGHILTLLSVTDGEADCGEVADALRGLADRVGVSPISGAAAGEMSVLVSLVSYPPEYNTSHGTHLAKVLSEVGSERYRQDCKRGGPDHDDGHSARMWMRLIRERALDATGDDGRQVMVEIAALAVAAIQTIDRAAIRGGGAMTATPAPALDTCPPELVMGLSWFSEKRYVPTWCYDHIPSPGLADCSFDLLSTRDVSQEFERVDGDRRPLGAITVMTASEEDWHARDYDWLLANKKTTIFFGCQSSWKNAYRIARILRSGGGHATLNIAPGAFLPALCLAPEHCIQANFAWQAA